MRASWTRDEVILGLDVLFSQNCQKLYKANPGMIELSELLNQLPIHPAGKKYDVFRNPVGVSSMLKNFLSGLDNPNQKYKVGGLFYSVFNEYKDNLEELHKIAQAIRRCLRDLSDLQYGDASEIEGFPEGAILSHLHRNVEARYTEKYIDSLDKCEICSIRPQNIYACLGKNSILSKHLLIPPADFDPSVNLVADNFITVCPNCHRTLHMVRPWRDRQNGENILIS